MEADISQVHLSKPPQQHIKLTTRRGSSWGGIADTATDWLGESKLPIESWNFKSMLMPSSLHICCSRLKAASMKNLASKGQSNHYTRHGTMILPWVMPVAQLWHLLLATVLRVFHFPRLWKGTCLLQQTVPVASNGKTGRNLDLASKQISSNFKIVLVLMRCSSLFIVFDRANETETAQALGDTATSYDPW